MTLSRKDLENDGLRAHFADSYPASQVLTPEQLDSSIEKILATHPAGEDLWLFGYGSLMWSPGFRPVDSSPALLRGYHRALCIRSIRYRGTPRRPGLVLGLRPGGSCWGKIGRAHV